MAKFIRVSVDGCEALVNVDHVQCIYREADGAATIVDSMGEFMTPDNSYDDIRRQVAAATGGFPVQSGIPEGMD